MASEKAKRMSFRVPVWVAGASFSACGLFWLFWGIYLYWNDIRLVNFLAAWIPFVLSTVVAFVPEHKMSAKKKILWRSSVISVGFVWSVVLWHQQVIADKTTKTDQERIVTQAINKSNEHSDTQIGNVRGDLKNQATKIDERLNTLESHLSESIGKVKPLPPPPPTFAHLQFSFYPPPDPQRFPLLIQSMRPDSNGTFTVDFVAKNVSGAVAVQKADIWMTICGECSFASEPIGFEEVDPTSEFVRHKFFDYLNHGVSIEWKLSVVVPSKFGAFETAFNYSCQTCEPGDQKAQTLTVYVIPPFTLSTPKPKSKARPRPS